MSFIHPFSLSLFAGAAILAVAGASILVIAILVGLGAANEALTIFSL